VRTVTCFGLSMVGVQNRIAGCVYPYESQGVVPRLQDSEYNRNIVSIGVVYGGTNCVMDVYTLL
jgi:hypothetical protein